MLGPFTVVTLSKYQLYTVSGGIVEFGLACWKLGGIFTLLQKQKLLIV